MIKYQRYKDNEIYTYPDIHTLKFDIQREYGVSEYQIYITIYGEVELYNKLGGKFACVGKVWESYD